MFKISHEVPICMLKESNQFNDYDYALIHLFQYPEYKKFYYEAVKKGREVLLDNSAFELGDSFNSFLFFQEVMSLKPSYYIIPDQLGNYEKTILNFEDWEKNYKGLPGQSVAVIQGGNEKEWITCFEYLNNSKVDKLAVSFGLSWFKDLCLAEGSNNFKKAMGRFIMINKIKDRIKKPLHLLGSYLFQEFKWYTQVNYSFLETVDTSFPIKSGYAGEIISATFDSKPSVLIDDFVCEKLSKETLYKIRTNIKYFKQYALGETE